MHRTNSLLRSLTLTLRFLLLPLIHVAPSHPLTAQVIPADIALFTLPSAFNLAAGVTDSGSETFYPGRCAVAFDGTNFLTVFPRTLGSPAGLTGTLVSRLGEVQTPFQLYPKAGTPTPELAFDGTNYLVVFMKNDYQTWGMRVSPSGQLLDGAEGFQISPGSGSAATPCAAFDGTNYLVVWRSWVGNPGLSAALVATSGDVLNRFPVCASKTDVTSPSVAFSGTNYLVVWAEGPVSLGWADIKAARVTTQGLVVDTNIICNASQSQSQPHVAFGSGVFFVAWVDERNGTYLNCGVYGARVDLDGTLLDGPPDTGGIPITTAPDSKSAPRVGFDAHNFYIVWAIPGYGGLAGIFASRVSPEGTLLDGPPENGRIPIQSPTTPEWDAQLAYPNLIFDGRNFLITWLDNRELSGTTKDIKASFIRPTKPSLFISTTDTNTIIVSWPYPSPGYELQETLGLEGEPWTTATNIPAQVGTNSQAIFPDPTGTRFFRLHSL